MKKGDLLNSDVSYVVATLGHTDALVIGDAGLPIPEHVDRIDLALTKGIPSFMDTARTVLSEMQVEQVVLAEEIKVHSAALHEEFLALIKLAATRQSSEIAINYISHEDLKARTFDSRAIVRTGECSPYANVIFCSGVVF